MVARAVTVGRRIRVYPDTTPVLALDGTLMARAATRRQHTHTLLAAVEQRAAADRSLVGPVVRDGLMETTTKAAPAALEAGVVVVPTTWAQAEAVGIQVEAEPA